MGTHCIIELWAWGRNIIVRGTKPRGKVLGTRPREKIVGTGPRIVGTPRKNCGWARQERNLWARGQG